MSKKRTSTGAGSAGLVKKVKIKDENSSIDQTLSTLRTVNDKRRAYKVDPLFPVSSFSSSSKSSDCSVYEDYDCMLNQTNIKANNNKFYLIQLIQENSSKILKFCVWTRWGRVGEVGQSAVLGPYSDIKLAKQTFERKFQDKTANKWVDRHSFQPKLKKYTLMELADDDDDCGGGAKEITKNVACISRSCTLRKETQSLLTRISSKDTFLHAMREMNIDVKKMPLGKLSSSQIVKAFEVLNEIEEVIEGTKKGDLIVLSSRFYTLVPHNFGRQRPPTITDHFLLRQKLDMLIILSDIALAQTYNQSIDSHLKEEDLLAPHPLDETYKFLGCNLEYVDPQEEMFAFLSNYFKNTQNGKFKIIHIWRVSRTGESDRIKKYEKITNRKLLWHGTNLGCIMAILKTGLRILPHSGGILGKGLYFASQSQKSLMYTYPDHDKHGLIFLVEVALGNEMKTKTHFHSIVKPNDGFDSVFAEGNFDYDPMDCKSTNLDGRKIIVPFSKAVNRHAQSTFHFNEFVIYDEAQCQLRFILEYT